MNGERKIDRLIAAGLVRPTPKPWSGPPPRPVKLGVTVSDIVSEQRR